MPILELLNHEKDFLAVGRLGRQFQIMFQVVFGRLKVPCFGVRYAALECDSWISQQSGLRSDPTRHVGYLIYCKMMGK